MAGFQNPAGPAAVAGTQTYKAPQLHKIITEVLNASATRRILWVGDSRLAGATSVLGPNTPGWFSVLPGFLVDLLIATLNCQRGLVIPVSFTDARWTLGAPWAYNNLTNGGWAPGTSGGTGGAAYIANSATGTLTFSASGINCDTFDIYFLQSTGLVATASANFSGGAGTAIPVNGGGANGVAKLTISGTAGTANTCNIVCTGSSVFPTAIVGVEPRLSTASQLLLGQAGVNGAFPATWNAAPGVSGWGSAQCVAAYAPDFTVINFSGLNDVFVGPSSVGSFLANIATMVASVGGPSKCIFLTEPCYNGGAAMAAYNAALLNYAASVTATPGIPGIPVIDLFTAWGGINAFADMNPYSYYNADGIHMTSLGYLDQGRLLAQALLGFTGIM